jgi:hypothetical protein
MDVGKESFGLKRNLDLKAGVSLILGYQYLDFFVLANIRI